MAFCAVGALLDFTSSAREYFLMVSAIARSGCLSEVVLPSTVALFAVWAGFMSTASRIRLTSH